MGRRRMWWVDFGSGQRMGSRDAVEEGVNVGKHTGI